MSDAFAWPALLGVLGAVFGSFIATIAIRWPRSALSGRSECDSCRRTLSAFELVPLVGYLTVRGRCRTCGGKIPVSHPATEAIGVVVGVTAGLVAPGWVGVAGAIFGWLLLAAAAVDLATYRLPNSITALIALTGLVLGGPALVERLIGGAIGFALLWLVARLYESVRHRVGLGGGDKKLFGAIGLWLGWRDLASVLLIACVLGIAVALVRRMATTDRLPLGTLLAIGAFDMWLVSMLR